MSSQQVDKHEQTRLAAEADLEVFGKLVHPLSVFGTIHQELIKWITREDAKSHQLVLLPRDHRKSYIAGLYAAWRITRDPTIRILYISSTSNLATKQLKLIKDILTSDIYRLFWPEMVRKEDSKREKWTETEISVDHPLRKKENVRDPTVFTAGLTTSVTGLHCDLCILDDVVVLENAYTAEGREKVALQYSLLSSVEGADAKELVVGTRYHPLDLYDTLLSKRLQIFDEQGTLTHDEDLYEVFKREVEDKGDLTGQYLWPRQQRADGKWFGFNQKILATKKEQYLDQTQFYAQYYNNPNSAENQAIPRDCFQYYAKDFVTRNNGNWYFKNNRLNIFAGMDFAYTKNKRSDYTAIIIVGVDCNNNYYVLDIDRFQVGPNPMAEYFQHLLKMHQKWGFHKIKAECTAAQEVIINDLKINYIRPYGLSLSIENFKPSRYQGAKEERILATLGPRYANRQVWHYMGGHCQTLEDELILAYPPHDDLKDCLATVVDACIPPTNTRYYFNSGNDVFSHTHRRFGGIA